MLKAENLKADTEWKRKECSQGRGRDQEYTGTV